MAACLMNSRRFMEFLRCESKNQIGSWSELE
jgi:hypothetical protein